ncbi:hypothetical protein DFH09DRAFT_1166056 [Mycena vulgaris]|nr:hypothetical protein DFH09DRAFT_1166056 [Mycena vulgaris]
MDASAVNANVTVDDFDSVLSYPDQAAWSTPDPSTTSFDAGSSPWLMGTYHSTRVANASAPRSTSSAPAGPAIDGVPTRGSAFAAENASAPHLLYGNADLAYAAHTLTLRNLATDGGSLLFDFLRTTVQLAPAGATVANQTLEETDKTLTYTGTWGSNKSPNFSGGGSTFTNADNASVSLAFHGSAIYVFGDKKNDHGPYRAVLDGGPAQLFDGVSGCGGAFAMTCEQMKPTLSHTLTIANVAGVNGSFFDLDSVVLSVPSVYAPRALGSATGTNASASVSASASASPSTTSTAGNGSLRVGGAPLLNPLLALVFGVVWLLRPARR